MKVLIVSGFLGAGKTTFIKEAIVRSGKKPVVLENEYGDTDLDKQSIGQAGELQILEFMEGCVCCTKKDTFVNTILTISAGLDPEYLIVEPSGIGKLGNVLAGLGKIRYERIDILPPIVIVSPRSFSANLSEYGEICIDQIRNAGRIVLSKIEGEDSSVIREAVERLRRIDPQADILDTPYQHVGPSFWESLFSVPGQVIEVSEPGSQGSPLLMQETIRSGSFDTAGDAVRFLETLVHGGFGDIVRAKGVFLVGGEWLRFDLADGLYELSGAPSESVKTQCVFIGKLVNRGLIEAEMLHRGVDPFPETRPHRKSEQEGALIKFSDYHSDK